MWKLITGKGENRFHFSLPTVAAGKTPASFDSFLHCLMRHGGKKKKNQNQNYVSITTEVKLRPNLVLTQIDGITKRFHHQTMNMD